MTGAALPVDTGLLARFRAAGKEIGWRAAPRTPGRPAPAGSALRRIAHLHDEEARVESRRVGKGYSVRVDSGPVGALALILEMDGRGLPTSLETAEAGALPGFDQGAIEARWGGAAPTRAQLPLHDLVELARYALA
ncbi:MAG TPA: hypothetical protein VEY07_06805 [Thermoplasmata archaeon]|nr:hypothetical protein [Thermoplasmata archaeon]